MDALGRAADGLLRNAARRTVPARATLAAMSTLYGIHTTSYGVLFSSQRNTYSARCARIGGAGSCSGEPAMRRVYLATNFMHAH